MEIMTHAEVVRMIQGLQNGFSYREVPHRCNEPVGVLADLFQHINSCQEKSCVVMRKKLEAATEFSKSLYGESSTNKYWIEVAAAFLFFIRGFTE